MEKEKQVGKDYLWKEFQDLFLQRYFSISVHEKKRKEFLYLTQGGHTVMEYDQEFTKLSRFARSLVATERDRVERFVNGLRMSLQKDLALCELSSHAEALDKALKAEWVRDQMNTDPRTGEKRRNQQGNRQGQKKGKWGNKKKDDRKVVGDCEKCGRSHAGRPCPKDTGGCYRCGELGHQVINCTRKACHQCGDVGHLVANCPKKSQGQQQSNQTRRGEGSSQPRGLKEGCTT